MSSKSCKLVQKGPIAVNFRSELRRRYDVKLSPARIFDLSLCRTLEMNPRKRSDGRDLKHFRNTVLKGIVVYNARTRE